METSVYPEMFGEVHQQGGYTLYDPWWPPICVQFGWHTVKPRIKQTQNSKKGAISPNNGTQWSQCAITSNTTRGQKLKVGCTNLSFSAMDGGTRKFFRMHAKPALNNHLADWLSWSLWKITQPKSRTEVSKQADSYHCSCPAPDTQKHTASLCP